MTEAFGSAGAAVVSGLSYTPVKGTRLLRAERLVLDRFGVAEDRRFFVIDARDRMLNGKQLGGLQAIVAGFDPASRRLRMEFPGGPVVEDEVSHVGRVEVRFFSRPREVRLVGGGWGEALSTFFEQPLRLVEAAAEGTAADRGVRGAVSLVSRASLSRLTEAGAGPPDSVDGRRFRMLVEVDGVAAHEEDEWVGGEITIGQVRLRLHGHVGRCLVTSRDPESGEVDLPTLDLLGSYRRDVASTEPLPFGVYGEVLVGGEVGLGDRVSCKR